VLICVKLKIKLFCFIAFGDFPEIIENLKINYQHWKDLQLSKDNQKSIMAKEEETS
jgi:hypothetical protein